MTLAAILNPLKILAWFLIQAISVGGLGAFYFVVPLLLLLLGMSFGLRRAPSGSGRRLLPLIVILPALWIFAGLWGGVFLCDWAQPGPCRPGWVIYPLYAAPVLWLLVSGFYLVKVSGARLFTVCYAALNLYFTMMMWFLGGMAITGSWL